MYETVTLNLFMQASVVMFFIEFLPFSHPSKGKYLFFTIHRSTRKQPSIFIALLIYPFAFIKCGSVCFCGNLFTEIQPYWLGFSTLLDSVSFEDSGFRLILSDSPGLGFELYGFPLMLSATTFCSCLTFLD